jgi:hypothetical protein
VWGGVGSLVIKGFGLQVLQMWGRGSGKGGGSWDGCREGHPRQPMVPLNTPRQDVCSLTASRSEKPRPHRYQGIFMVSSWGPWWCRYVTASSHMTYTSHGALADGAGDARPVGVTHGGWVGGEGT